MPKVYRLLTPLLIAISIAVSAQQPDRCATMQKYKEAVAKDPSIALHLESLEQLTKETILGSSATSDTSIYVIPVVVHVVYHSFSAAAQNISDAQIFSQIDAINEDFSRLNADTANTPAAFKPVAVDTKIRFQLTNKDPNGNPSTGIERISTSINNVGSDNNLYTIAPAWDRTCYYNVWVCNIDGGNTLGFSFLPGTVAADRDGTVIDFKAFGRVGTLYPSFNKGHTLTHEAGHFLNLLHTWGDSPSCTPDDNVNDTPLESDASTGCPTYPLTDACTPAAPGVMFMNYMNYVDDACMNLFTAGQRDRMRAALRLAPRDRLRDRSACNVLGIKEATSQYITLYPNPTESSLYIKLPLACKPKTLEVFDALGQQVMLLQQPILNENTLNIDTSKLSTGIYFIRLMTQEQVYQSRFIHK